MLADSEFTTVDPSAGSGLIGPGEHLGAGGWRHSTYGSKTEETDESDYNDENEEEDDDEDEGEEENDDDDDERDNRRRKNNRKRNTKMASKSSNQRLSVFNYNPADYLPTKSHRNSNDDDDGEEYYDDSSRAKNAVKVVPFTRPQDLPPNASAAEVIKAWAAQLKEVYDKCAAPHGSDYLDVEGYPLNQQVSGNVRLIRKTVPRKLLSSSSGRSKSNQLNVGESGDVADINMKNKTLTFNTQSKQQLGVGRKVDWKTELKRFYMAINKPNKVDNDSFDQILRLWAGKEDMMIASLVDKYRGMIPPHLMLHLDQLQSILETQSTRSNNARSRQL